MRMHLTRFAVAALVLVLGAAFASSGRAAGPGEACGAGTACNPPLLCQTAAGQCGVTDAKGSCERVPAFCQKIYRQVCGCNGKTYVNDCERQRARVQVDHIGACKKASG
jgi:Kazal-type serine protease inhibitor domain